MTTTAQVPRAVPAPAHQARSREGVRTDIQGLRAIAVSLVLVYHLAPGWVPGGYVGVDVFFVISGFLITAHLLQHAPSGGRDLATFWSRRIRRLLPASLLVLTTTLIGTWLISPETQWDNTARQARAAALYVVNWLLARDAVDYLAAQDAPTPVQHFWSLSIEEQFYVFWPVAILLLVLLARRRRWPLTLVVGAGLAAAVVLSLWDSIHETATDPAAAYFVTPARIWELGIGGLLALLTAPRVLGRRPEPLRPGPSLSWALTVGGLVAIAWSAMTYSGATPFPGWRALVPVLGSALVIAGYARPIGSASPGRLLATRPVQWLGDASYSVYLWHWPLIVLTVYAAGGTGPELSNPQRLLVLTLTLVLAGLTKTYVEDPFRAGRWGVPLRKPYLLGAAGMAVVVVIATLMVSVVTHREAESEARIAAGLAGRDPCFGAAALEPGTSCAPVPYDDVLPTPVEAAEDKSDAYPSVSHGASCWSGPPPYPQVTCERGDPDGRTTIALVGNSHGGQWLPALEELADRKHWRIVTHLASRCALSDVAQTAATPAQSDTCRAWVRGTVEALVRSKPDLVLMSNRVAFPAVGHTVEDSGPAYEAGYETVLQELDRAGLQVLVLRDTPAPGFPIPDCVAERGDAYSECDGTRAAWLHLEPAEAAVAALDSRRIRFLDLTDHLCADSVCHAVTGGIITYFDGSHMTATFARTLAPYLDAPISRQLSAPQTG